MTVPASARLTVTSPLLPDLEEFHAELRRIWESRWLTNNGTYHQRFEQALMQHLGVPYMSVFTNGTLPLITALQALRITGEVITTPYSFVATTHALWWNGIRPVFVDVEPHGVCLDPERIEAAITPHTTAILAVHVYGRPCNTRRIAEIADYYGLRVIYDAAHAFGVEVGGQSILRAGDLSTLSFHATKVFNTIEGGAMVMQDAATKRRVDYLKNFGFADEVTVVGPGINSKLDEVRAAYGLLNLARIDAAIAARRRASELYRAALSGVPGISLLDDPPDTRYNYAYFPIFVAERSYGRTRDELYARLQEQGIYGRRYFYPLISEFVTYRGLPSADPRNLPHAHQLARTVICLPLHHALSEEDVLRVAEAVRSGQRQAGARGGRPGGRAAPGGS